MYSILNYATLLLFCFLPGYMVIRLDTKLAKSFWLTLVYSFTFSNIFLLIVGGVLNFSLPFFGYAEPLTRFPIIVSSLLLLQILVWTSFIIKKPKPLRFNSIKFNKSKFLQLLLLFIVPVPGLLVLLGTMSLNANDSNLFSLIGLGVMCLQMPLMILFSKIFKEKSFFYLYCIVCFAIGIILMTSLRGQHVTGSDIMLEYRMAAIAAENKIWMPTSPDHSYNACVSITILPVIMSLIGDISLTLVFKTVLQFSTIFAVILVFYIAKKYSNEHLAYVSSLAFISFPAFFNIMPMHTRQSLALLLFFICIHLVIENTKSILRYSFFLLCSVGMILSHYSTTYLAAGIFLSYYGFGYLYYVVGKTRFKTFLQMEKHDFHSYFRYINIFFIFFFFLVMYVWYFRITHVAEGFVNFIEKVETNLKSHSSIASKEESSFTNQFNIFFKPSDQTNFALEYQKKIIQDYQNGEDSNPQQFLLKNYQIGLQKVENVSEQKLTPILTGKILSFSLIFADFIKKIYKVFTISGVLLILFEYFFLKKKKYDLKFLTLIFLSFSLIMCFTILPFFNVDYDIFRAYYQMLILLALPSVLGLIFFGFSFSQNRKVFLAACFFSLYFFINSRLYYETTGGYPQSLVLDNSGDDFNRYYIKRSEMLSTHWIMEHKGEFIPIFADTYMKIKMRSLSTQEALVSDELTIGSIEARSYVLFSQSNLQQNVAYKNFLNHLLRYRPPVSFISEHKNKIYSNRNSEIYN